MSRTFLLLLTLVLQATAAPGSAVNAGSPASVSTEIGEDQGGLLSLDAAALDTATMPAPPNPKPWHFEFGFRTSCTKLEETEEMLDQRLDPALALDVFHLFHRPRTPIDRKSEFSLVSFYMGAGRQESDYFLWTWYAGGGTGSDHDHQRVLNINLEVTFKYAYVYTGLTGEFYPWRVPKADDYTDWNDRLTASRPFVAGGIETGYVSGEGRGHWALAPVKLYKDKEVVRDWITSLNLGLGWNLPVNRRWSLVFMGDYRWHFYRPDEYNGWTLTTALRYAFP